LRSARQAGDEVQGDGPHADGQHTVAQIATLLGVSRRTIYRALEPEAVAG
jgi:hypothetical protein